MIVRCSAWLSPGMMKTIESVCVSHARGAVHSVFDSAANLSFAHPETETPRLFTLVNNGQFRLPDSASVPAGVIRSLEPGMPLSARRTSTGLELRIQENILCLIVQTDWTGRQAGRGKAMPSICRERVQEAARFLASVPNGFDRLPEALRERAQAALLTQDAPSFLGLGAGLTPAFDDACVGVMACCAAFGYPVPFQLADLHATTDISARYLGLAGEGFFSEPICMLMNAWSGEGDLKTALDALLSVGATSGADALFGAVRMASLHAN